MAGFMDILLALVKVLCGGSTTQEQLPSEHPPNQKPHTERPPPRPTTTWPAPQGQRPSVAGKSEHRRKTQERPPKPTFESNVLPADRPQSPQPQHERKRHQVFPSNFVLHPSERNCFLKDQNQINQHNEQYMALRAKANQEGDLMAQSFQGSHEAYARGDGAHAKELSEQGKQHERTMESLNAEASAWIFKENNLDSKPGEVDLHGLYVKEAVSYSDKAIQEARQRGDSEIRLIVGKGLHSDGRVAKIKPAVEDLTKKHNLFAEVDPQNAGILIVRLR
ncbi:DUF1771-domain-containing protein [Gyrodon lividus]|nr:DUF1771-domain-containing protein [Gyrodon lividus]